LGEEKNLAHLAGFESGFIGLPVIKQSLFIQKLWDDGTDCTVRNTLIVFEGVSGLDAFLLKCDVLVEAAEGRTRGKLTKKTCIVFPKGRLHKGIISYL